MIKINESHCTGTHASPEANGISRSFYCQRLAKQKYAGLEFISNSQNPPFQMKLPVLCHNLLTIYFPISPFYHMSLADGDWCIQSSAFNLAFLLPDREVLLLPSTPPPLPPAPHNPSWKPFDVHFTPQPSKLWNLNFLIRATSICQEILFLDLTEIELHALQ